MKDRILYLSKRPVKRKVDKAKEACNVAQTALRLGMATQREAGKIAEHEFKHVRRDDGLVIFDLRIPANTPKGDLSNAAGTANCTFLGRHRTEEQEYENVTGPGWNDMSNIDYDIAESIEEKWGLSHDSSNEHGLSGFFTGRKEHLELILKARKETGVEAKQERDGWRLTYPSRGKRLFHFRLRNFALYDGPDGLRDLAKTILKMDGK